MPLRTSEAFVIDVRKLQEADRLVVLFTQEDGKVRGVAASAARSRRRFGGRLERLSRIRATWFEREGRDLCRIDACDLIDESFSLYGTLEGAALLAYIAEIVETFSREREADPRFYRLLGSVIDSLRAGGAPRVLARYFEVWTLRLQGLLPDMAVCAACGDAIGGAAATVVLGDLPGPVCSRCRRAGTSGAEAIEVAAPTMAVLERIRITSPAALARERCDARSLEECGRLMDRMLGNFVGHPFRSRRFLREVLDA